jgi:formylglycine-generating enzyme required for sulfatase activity/energy-coupling factor transporter ATP-binding protein EcfA2
MDIVEITLQRNLGSTWPVVVEYSVPGLFLPVRREGTFALDPVVLQSQPTAKEYGTVLGKALFRDEVRDSLTQAIALSDRLRILLSVEADDLRTLRWERLCIPLDGEWDFLALNARVPYSLYLPSVTERRFPPIGRRDLRALIVAASPNGLADYRLEPFDVTTAVGGVKAALGEIPCHVLANVDGAAGPPTLDALCERITAGHYTLLHIVCHGRYQRSNSQTVLFLADSSGGVDAVDNTHLLERLRPLRGARGLPHCTFLATCESASAEAEGVFGGLAQRLVRELGMPAVVAMTERVAMETAQALATGFYQQLRRHGEVDRALVEACTQLAGQHELPVPVLYSRLGGRPLFSDALDRNLTDEEISAGLAETELHLKRRAPVLIKPFRQQAKALRGLLGRDPSVLSKEGRTAQEEALATVNSLCEEALDISFNAIAAGQEPPDYDAHCPFRGLQAFRVEDRRFFFGREALVAQVAGRLIEQEDTSEAGGAFLAVLGSSGSGKSSLVLAGLSPALQERQPELRLAYTTPGNDPPASLETALSSLDRRPALLVIDQFEELFTLCGGEERRQMFIQRLLELCRQLPVVITMRADFWGDCAPYPDLKALMLTRQELIAPMTTRELRQSMEMQAASVGLRFEADLSASMMDDVADEPGAMPLLQHALLELWERRHGRWLRAAEYRATGGVQKAVAVSADRAYRKFLQNVQGEQVRDIFLRLTRLDTTPAMGEQRRDTRRRVALKALAPAGRDLASTRAIVQELAGERLVVITPGEAPGEEQVEVVHEALIQHWPRLQRWLDEDRDVLRLRQGIGQAAEEWQQAGRDENLLVHRGSRLQEAEAFLAESGTYLLNQLERAYVEAAVALRKQQQAKEKEQRRLQRLLAGLAIILGLALLIIGSYFARRELLRQLARQEVPLQPVGDGPAFEVLETSNARWRRCVEAGPCFQPSLLSSTYYEDGQDLLPITGIDAQQAAAFCRWIGRRLPTLEEWTFAARESEGAPWPYGKSVPGSDLAYLGNDSGTGSPKLVGTRNSTAPGEIYDLIGNVAEWTASIAAETVGETSGVWDGNPATAPGRLYHAGGHFRTTATALANNGLVTDITPNQRTPYLGVRCVAP